MPMARANPVLTITLSGSVLTPVSPSTNSPEPMTDLTSLTLAAALDGMEKKAFSSAELTDAFLGAIDKANLALNAYLVVTADKARANAKASDAKRAKGATGPLEGAPLWIKDLFCTEGVRTTAGSAILGEFAPAYESTVTSQLWRDGAVMLGKLNMDEFAMGSSNETSHFGPVVSPWRRGNEDAKLTPGGSSGGSAAAVSADLCLGAIATDTGGSIRQPAAFTGTVGVKPTYGRCSRWGIVAFASSLDQAGPIAKTVEDAAILLKSMAGHDPKDSTSLPVETRDFRKACSRSIKGMTIGVPEEYRVAGMPEEIEKLWAQGIEWAKEAGAKIKPISLKHTKYALPCYSPPPEPPSQAPARRRTALLLPTASDREALRSPSLRSRRPSLPGHGRAQAARSSSRRSGSSPPESAAPTRWR